MHLADNMQAMQKNPARYIGFSSILLWLCLYSLVGHTAPIVVLPKTALEPVEIGIIINDADKLSRQTGEYYRQQRNIPPENLIHINFKPGRTNMPVAEFKHLKQQVDEATPSGVQAYVITWLKPYRVSCMSITSAFAFGFNKEEYCATGCKSTKISPYFNSASHAPFTDYEIRPTIVLAGNTLDEVKQLVQRGISSDNTVPTGTAYLLDTNDKHRNIRAHFYEKSINYMRNIIDVKRVRAQSIENKNDILFYVTGLMRVDGLNSNTFLPGAIADHLTSTGGQLTDSKQMSIMEWIRAGATGSYGTVVEPCNLPTKFPHPLVVMDKYTSGGTLIESYWKSVAMPGQGIFVGEPLARPYGGYKLIEQDGKFRIRTWSLDRGRYTLLGAKAGVGPFHVLGQFKVSQRGPQDIDLQKSTDSFLRIKKVEKPNELFGNNFQKLPP